MVKEEFVWPHIRDEANQLVESEPAMSAFLQRTILDHSSFSEALGHTLADQLVDSDWTSANLSKIIGEALEADSQIATNAYLDLSASFERDAACDKYLTPLLYFKGFQALQLQRIANWFWENDRCEVAFFLQSRMAEVFHVDIHPGAKIGSGIMLDHATGLVVGETAIIGNNVSVLHSVTLGGNGNSGGKRHPTIGDGVMISAGAKLIGDINIGEGTKIGAGSLVLKSMPAHATVVGVPASVVGMPLDEIPALNMNHNLDG